MDNKYYIIAGNAAESNTFAKKKAQDFWNLGISHITLSHFIYVDSRERLLGLKNPSGFFIGTWKDHPKIEEIMVALAVAVYNDIGKSKLIKELWKDMRAEV